MVATECYSETLYHTITLPDRLLNVDGSNWMDLLKKGSNVIAIAIITMGEEKSDFDASIRLMTNQGESHMWEMRGSVNGILGEAEYAFDGYYGTSIGQTSCSSNELTITLNNDRREYWYNYLATTSVLLPSFFLPLHLLHNHPTLNPHSCRKHVITAHLLRHWCVLEFGTDWYVQ